MESTVTYARPELLLVAETVARDKGIDRDEVLEAMEQAIQKAGRSKYGQEYDIRAEIDRKSGEIRLLRFREVAEPIENEAAQIALSEAQRLNPEAEIGDFITDPLPPIDFGRIAAQTAKQVIVQKVRDAERQRQFLEFKDRVGEIINGLVKRVEFGNVVVDLGRAEAMARRDELLPRESFRQGERVRAYIYDVRQEPRGPQIFLSRTHPQFMAKLFAQEVPEIYDGIIEIKAVARDPGSRAKIAVVSRDSGIDPVGACVGMRGSRVQAVVGELQGEKIDIVPWSSDPATFVVNALAPAEVAKVVMDEEQRRVEVVVPDDQLSLAIGRRGQNVRLGSQLTGWDIDILTEAEESERRTEEFRSRSKMFIDALDIDDVIAHLLVTEGFSSLEEVAYVTPEDLADIEGFDAEIGVELQERARAALERRDREYEERRHELGVEDDLAALDGLTPGMLVALGEKEVKTLDDFADLAGDELLELLAASDKGGVTIDLEAANALIMRARAHWFEDEAPRRRRRGRSRRDGPRRDLPGAKAPRGGGRRGPAPLPGDRRNRRPLAAAALCRRPRRRDRARRCGASARTGFVVDAAPGYSGSRGRQTIVCARGAPAGRGVRGSRRSHRGIAGAALRRRDRARPPGRPCSRRLRTRVAGGAGRPGGAAARGPRRSRGRAAQAAAARARAGGRMRLDRGRNGRGLWSRAGGERVAWVWPAMRPAAGGCGEDCRLSREGGGRASADTRSGRAGAAR